MEIKLNRPTIENLRTTLEEWYRDLEYSKEHVGGSVFDPAADAIRIVKLVNKIEGARQVLNAVGLFAYFDGETVKLMNALTNEEI